MKLCNFTAEQDDWITFLYNCKKNKTKAGPELRKYIKEYNQKQEEKEKKKGDTHERKICM